MKKPLVSIIIINYHSYKDTLECLKSVFKTGYENFIVYLVDNGSETGEMEKIRETVADKRLKLVQNKINTGFAKANNDVLKKLKAGYAVLLNNDTTVEPEWLSELVSQAENDKGIAVLQPKIMSYFNRKYFEYAGGAGGYVDKLGYPYVRGRVGFELEEDIGQYDDPSRLFWACGSAMMIRVSVMEKVGYLDESFFMYQEEIDWCWRVNNLGYKIYFCHESVIYHKGAQSAKKNLMKRGYYVHRNNLLMVCRNMPVYGLVYVLPVRILLDFASGFYYFYKQSYSLMGAVVWAYISLLTMVPEIIRERKKISGNRNDAYDLLKPFSIYFNYFILRKRRFTDTFKPEFKTARKSGLIPYKIY